MSIVDDAIAGDVRAYATQVRAALADLGVRDHVLQQVRPDGATDEYAQALARVPRERLHRG